MNYQINIENLSPLLETINKKNDFVINRNIYKMFMNFNFHKIASTEQDKLFPILKEIYLDLKSSQLEKADTDADKKRILKIFKNHNLDIEFLKTVNVKEFKETLLLEGENILKVNDNNFDSIKDAIYRRQDRDEQIISLININDEIFFKEDKDYWNLQALLLSQGFFIEDILSNEKNGYVLMEGESLESQFKVEKTNVYYNQDNSVLNNPLDIELFTSVINKYLNEKTDEQVFDTLIDKIKHLKENLNKNDDYTFAQLLSILKEGGVEVFEDSEMFKEYLDIVVFQARKDNVINYFTENNIKNLSKHELNFPIFYKNDKIRKNILSVDPLIFFEMAVGSDPKTFEVNPSINEIESLANTVMSQILKIAKKMKKSELKYEQDINIILKDISPKTKEKEIENTTVEALSKDATLNFSRGWYIASMLMEKNFDASQYWEQLRKYFILPETHESRLKLDEYSYVHVNAKVAFEIVSQGLRIINKIQNKEDINIKDLEKFINIYPLSYDNVENSMMAINIANVAQDLQYLCKEEDVLNSDIFNLNMQKYFVLANPISSEQERFNYSELAQRFLNGSTSPVDDLFLGVAHKSLLDINREKVNTLFKFMENFVTDINQGNINFNGKIVKSPEDLVSQMFNSEDERFKKYGFILYYTFPKIVNFDTEIELDKESFKSIFKHYKRNLQRKGLSILKVNDRLFDFTSDGKLEVNDSNKEIFNLSLEDIEIIDYVKGNKDFFKDEKVVFSYLYDARESSSDYLLSGLWSSIYKEVGGRFFHELWSELKKKEDLEEKIQTGQKFNFSSLKKVNVDLTTSHLMSFYMMNNKSFDVVTMSEDVLFDKESINMVNSLTNYNNKDWVKKIPVEYYRHPDALNILELLGCTHINKKEFLQTFPKEIFSSPKNILLALSKTTKKLEVLEVVCPLLYNYCVTNNVKDIDVTEKVELIFNTMVLEKFASKNNTSKASKAPIKF